MAALIIAQADGVARSVRAIAEQTGAQLFRASG